MMYEREREQAALAFRVKIINRIPALFKNLEAPIPNPPRVFWDYFNANRDEFSAAGIGVRKKDTGDWVICAYPFDLEEHKQQVIERLLEKHSLICDMCGCESVIQRGIMKDNRVMFRYFCEHCDCGRGGLLPHKLVEHLTKCRNVDLIDDKGEKN